jgi:hypothetical protein
MEDGRGRVDYGRMDYGRMDDGEARQEGSVNLNRYGPLITFCELAMW